MGDHLSLRIPSIVELSPTRLPATPIATKLALHNNLLTNCAQLLPVIRLGKKVKKSIRGGNTKAKKTPPLKPTNGWNVYSMNYEFNKRKP